MALINWPVIRPWQNWAVVAFALILWGAIFTLIQPFKSDDGAA